MSTVNAKVEHLIRASITSIKANPETWRQSSWVLDPADFKAMQLAVPSCGTTYCLGGWMLLYDGWSHKPRGERGHSWTKGDASIEEPYGDFLAALVYGDGEAPELFRSIFSTKMTALESLTWKIQADLDINFEEDCPCLTEPDSCNLQGCPCGTHTLALMTKPSPPVEIEASALKVIEEFVQGCRQAGDNITVAQVLADRVLMKAFGAMFAAGELALLETVTKKAERRIAEVRMQLQGEEAIRKELTSVIESHNRLVLENAKLRASGTVSIEAENVRLEKVVRRLQGRVDEYFFQSRKSPEFVKLKAANKRLALENAVLRERIEDFARPGRKLYT